MEPDVGSWQRPDISHCHLYRGTIAWTPPTAVYWECTVLGMGHGTKFHSPATGWETKICGHSPELGSIFYSLYKIPLVQACFTLARPYFHSQMASGRALVSQQLPISYPCTVPDHTSFSLQKQGSTLRVVRSSNPTIFVLQTSWVDNLVVQF